MKAQRIALLRQDIQHALSSLPAGAPSVARAHQQLFESLVNDLIALGWVVPNLQAVRKPQLTVLIKHWQLRGLASNTIYRNISLLRGVITHYLPHHDFPDNPTLGLQYTRKKIIFDYQDAHLDGMTNEVVRAICLLQQHFGLKKQEAIYFSPHMVTPDSLFVSRKVAHNNQNRVIPFWNEAQLALVTQLKAMTVSGFFEQGYTPSLLSTLHQQAMQQLHYPDKEYLRHHYLVSRFRHLQLHASSLSYHQRLATLRQELGYRDNSHIKRILACLDNF